MFSCPEGDGRISLVFVVAGASPSPSVCPPKSALMMVAAKGKVLAAAAVVAVRELSAVAAVVAVAAVAVRM